MSGGRPDAPSYQEEYNGPSPQALSTQPSSKSRCRRPEVVQSAEAHPAEAHPAEAGASLRGCAVTSTGSVSSSGTCGKAEELLASWCCAPATAIPCAQCAQRTI